jgi:hypothetical protein
MLVKEIMNIYPGNKEQDQAILRSYDIFPKGEESDPTIGLIFSILFTIFMTLQPFVGPWPLFQFADPIYIR